MPDAKRINSWHAHLRKIAPVLPSDYDFYGGTVERWKNEDTEAYPDCSGGCYWARWLGDGLGSDWCVCSRPGAPRCGSLTFEHQAGKMQDCVTPCFESPAEHRRRVKAEKGKSNAGS